jgi:catechol 2,3-dioxygenase-like lactoylglutathione lyase family enzyme
MLFLFVFCVSANAQKPILFDNLHYCVTDSLHKHAAIEYLSTFFKAKLMQEEPSNPISHTEILMLGVDEATINISNSTMFQDLKIEKKYATKSKPMLRTPQALPNYGVRWLAVSTKSIKKTIKYLLKAGYTFSEDSFELPTEPETIAVAMYGFDNNIIVLVERPKLKNTTLFCIDHIQLMVENLEESVKFYEEIVGAEVIGKKERSTVLKIGKQKFVLSEPEVLGYSHEQIKPQDLKQNFAQAEHLTFLYDDIEPAYYAAKAYNYRIIAEPQKILFNEKPTPYTVFSVLTPDNFSIVLQEENGRLGYRKTYKIDSAKRK